MLDRLLEGQFTSDAWELYPDVEPMLVAVREMGVHIGVVSDWGSNLRDILAGLELDRYLDFVLPSGSVGLAKPNPAFFRLALDAADARPEEALMVGDSYRADIRGAWAAYPPEALRALLTEAGGAHVHTHLLSLGGGIVAWGVRAVR